MIAIIGDAFVDLVVPTKNLIPNCAVLGDLNISFGGTANVAVWLSRLGVKSSFFGKVGDDVMGAGFKKSLHCEGVADLTIIDNENPTGLCLSLIDGNYNRSMITQRGANDFICPTDLDELTLDIDIAYFVGYSFLANPTSGTISNLMKILHERGCDIYFNPGSANIISSEIISAIKKYSNTLILNLDEGTALTGLTEASEIAINLSSWCDKVVLTMGEKGSVAVTKDEYIFNNSQNVDVISDTTGAGDAFSAGFLAGTVNNLDLKQSCELGHNTAAKAIQNFGAR